MAGNEASTALSSSTPSNGVPEGGASPATAPAAAGAPSDTGAAAAAAGLPSVGAWAATLAGGEDP